MFYLFVCPPSEREGETRAKWWAPCCVPLTGPQFNWRHYRWFSMRNTFCCWGNLYAHHLRDKSLRNPESATEEEEYLFLLGGLNRPSAVGYSNTFLRLELCVEEERTHIEGEKSLFFFFFFLVFSPYIFHLEWSKRDRRSSSRWPRRAYFLLDGRHKNRCVSL